MGKNLHLTVMARDVNKEKPHRLRKEGMIPAVIYGHKMETMAIKINSLDFFKVFHGHIAENVLIDLELKDAPGKSKTVIIKDFQKNPIKDEYFHIDFVEIRATEKLSTHVPIHLKGKAPGVAKGGILEHTLRELHIECLPKDIPAEIAVDVSGLDIGHSIHVKDLVLPPEVKVLSPAEMIVAAVTVLKKEAEPVAAEAGVAEAAAGEAAAAEPELIKKERAKDEEEEKAEKPEKAKPEKAEKPEKDKGKK